MDASGRRLVSLVPSITETVLDWGVTPVAVTRFCDAPGLPTVGGTKNPDIEAIVDLAPDAVLMDEEENRRPDANAIAAAGLLVVATRVRGLTDVSGAMADIAAAAAIKPPRSPLGSLADSTAGDLPAGVRRLRVLVPIWRRPWMTIGSSTYGTDILRAAGLYNIYGRAADPYPTIDLDDAQERRPDLVLVPSEPYAFKDRHFEELSRVAPAVRVDGRDLFWWGTRSPGALDRLTRMARSPACQDPPANT